MFNYQVSTILTYMHFVLDFSRCYLHGQACWFTMWCTHWGPSSGCKQTVWIWVSSCS